MDLAPAASYYEVEGESMGTFRHPVELAATETGPFVAVDALVETGATYSLFPRTLLTRLGVVPHDRAEFLLADGRSIARELATVVSRLYGRTRHVLCIVGEDESALIGATTLELFGLMADPVTRRLTRAPLYLTGLAA
ncbi:MAG: retroviral-like aspartic protease family protein [Armatimonadota bacterium]